MRLPNDVLSACTVGTVVSLPVTVSTYFRFHPGLTTGAWMMLTQVAIMSFPAMLYGIVRWSQNRAAKAGRVRAARIEAYRRSPESRLLRLD
jgi:hypothetical protein